ncbi:response regulator [Amycolatopsis magusensis]|uniref:response regulator n=1 Tax=Amycolatopsis magusensis TaxID=882444 RepID=UPI0024A94AC4|nr:response regulator [Amycolatopsis magusensis]MDI5979609.1 response regulator [Amycolatopsis magusensis]
MYDVVFVDDDGELARVWAELVSSRLALDCISSDSASDAYTLIEERGAKIVVLDQRMPEEDGTSLGRRIAALDPRVALVLVSGEASFNEAGEANDVGFISIIHKNEALSRLPDLLQRLIIQYELDIAQEVDGVDLRIDRRRFWRRRIPIVFRVLSIDEPKVDVVFPESWRTRVKLNAGETRSYTAKVSWSQAREVEIESNTKYAANLGVTAGDKAKINSALQSEIMNKIRSKVAVNYSEEIEFQRTITLPPEPADPEKLHVRSRSYDDAPVYARVSARVAFTCQCCGKISVEIITICVPIKKCATRQVDYLSDGRVHEAITGFEDI